MARTAVEVGWSECTMPSHCVCEEASCTERWLLGTRRNWKKKEERSPGRGRGSSSWPRALVATWPACLPSWPTSLPSWLNSLP